MRLLGIQKLFLSNAAGGINLNFKKGDLVLIDDHINLLCGNPLTGKIYDELGSRFPDMSEPYDVQLKNLLQAKSKCVRHLIKERNICCRTRTKS